MIFSFTKYNNADAAVNLLLKNLSINIDPATISSELDQHPDYPSLLAISDVLTALNVDNAAYRVDADNLMNVPCPFIAHTNLNSGDFLVVNKIDGEKVIVSSEKWNKHKLDLKQFKDMFNGIVLSAEPSENFTTTTTFKTFITSLKTPAIVAGLLLMLALALIFHTGYFISLSWSIVLLTIFKSAGLVTSILLLVQSIDSNNPLVQVLCQSVGKSDCNAILSSKAAKVFEGLTWSEVGFFYFAGTWLLLLFGGGSITIMWMVAILNFVSLPYTIYSIYYQARVAKQWCILCCTVQALLWLEFIPLVYTASKNPLSFTEGWGGAEWSALVICLLSPVILWMLLKPMFLKLQQLAPLKQQLRKFKYNAELFNRMLTAQPRYAQPDEAWCIVLGNPEANNVITMVTNPYCPPCAKAHKLLDEFVDQNAGIQARIVFTANNTDDDIKTPVSRHLMALNDLSDKTIVRHALHDWYEQKQKNYDAWAKVYPVPLNGVEFTKLDRQKEWCNMAEVKATPTMLLNGYVLPELYQLADLKYMLE